MHGLPCDGIRQSTACHVMESLHQEDKDAEHFLPHDASGHMEQGWQERSRQPTLGHRLQDASATGGTSARKERAERTHHQPTRPNGHLTDTRETRRTDAHSNSLYNRRKEEPQCASAGGWMKTNHGVSTGWDPTQ